MAQTSDIDQVVAWLDQFAHGFVFTRPGRDQSLGRDIVKVEIQRINDRCSWHVDPDGVAWLENFTTVSPERKESYKAWKGPIPRSGDIEVLTW